MHNLFRILVLSSLTLFLVAPAASAKDMRGRLGVGVEQTLGGVSGATVRYWMGPKLGVVATLGLEVVTVDATETTPDRVLSTGGASLGAMYTVASSLHASLSVGFRAVTGIGLESGEQGEDPTTTIQFGAEVPVMVEFFLSESFSVSASTGLRFLKSPSSGEGTVLKPSGRLDDSVTGDMLLGIGAGSVLGGMGIVYYF